jgi:hypothetical protein
MEQAIQDDAKIDGFTDRMTTKWGEEETQLRLAIYISFVKEQDTMSYRKKTKKRRQSVIASVRNSSVNQRRTSAINSDETQKVPEFGKTARRVSQFRKNSSAKSPKGTPDSMPENQLFYFSGKFGGVLSGTDA